MLNLRRSFEDMLVKWGHWCALRKFLRDQPVSAAYEAYYEEASRRAIQELTAGRPFVDHIVRMVKRTVVPGFEKRIQAGVADLPGEFFYIQSSVMPTGEDWILELAQKEVRKKASPIRPYRVTRFYRIMDVEEKRMENGRMIYFRCRVEESQVGGSN